MILLFCQSEERKAIRHGWKLNVIQESEEKKKSRPNFNMNYRRVLLNILLSLVHLFIHLENSCKIVNMKGINLISHVLCQVNAGRYSTALTTSLLGGPYRLPTRAEFLLKGFCIAGSPLIWWHLTWCVRASLWYSNALPSLTVLDNSPLSKAQRHCSVFLERRPGCIEI